MQLTRTTLINAVAYRGDTRPPEEIFIDGLWNRQKPEAQWLELLAQGESDDVGIKFRKPRMTHTLNEQQIEIFEKEPKDCDPPHHEKLVYKAWVKSNPAIFVTYTFQSGQPLQTTRKDLWQHYITNLPVYREGNAGEDISPKSAVCLTLRAHVAPYFPIDGCIGKTGGEWIWMYAVLLGAAYKTYAVQKDRATQNKTYSSRAEQMTRAQEVAVEHVSPTDIICAVHCWRWGKFPQMQFLLAPRICWNYRSRSRLLCQREIVATLNRFQVRRTKVIACEVEWIKTKDAIETALQEPNYAYHLWQR